MIIWGIYFLSNRTIQNSPSEDRYRLNYMSNGKIGDPGARIYQRLLFQLTILT
jgi:hypothetical protein